MRGEPVRLLPSLLWKEWRDHRAALLGYFVGIPPLVAWGLSAFAAATRKDPMMPSAAAVGGFAIAALTLFGDLFAGEEQRNTIRLLRRLPGGLLRVFVVKIGFALIAALAMSGWAWLATTSASVFLYGGSFAPRLALPGLAWLTLLFPLAAWISATAIWLSRATLALPAAALTLALFAAPIGASFWLHPGMKPTARELLVAFWTLIAAAPLVAGLSFVLGRRRSTSAFAPARVGLVATLALFTPAYAWTGVRVARWLRIEPASASFRIEASQGALDASGRYAYVNAFQLAPDLVVRGVTDHDPERGDSALRPLRVDLASGAWSEVAPRGAVLFGPGTDWNTGRNATAVVAVLEERPTAPGARGDQPGWRLLDAARGEPFEPSLLASLLKFEGERAGELGRVSSYVQLPDGRRVWRQDGKLMVDAEPAAERVANAARPLPDSCFDGVPLFLSFSRAGFGARVGYNADGTSAWYDLLRERRFAVANRVWVRWVRAPRWIVHPLSPGGNAAFEQLYDPESGTCAPVAGLRRDSAQVDSIVDLANDGRLLVATRAAKRSKTPAAPQPPEPQVPITLALLDPETGDREPLALPDEIAVELAGARLAGRTSSGAQLLWLGGQRDDHVWFARLDLGATSIGSPAVPGLVASGRLDRSELLGASDESTLVVIEDSRRLVRIHLDGVPPETLFPR